MPTYVKNKRGRTYRGTKRFAVVLIQRLFRYKISPLWCAAEPVICASVAFCCQLPIQPHRKPSGDEEGHKKTSTTEMLLSHRRNLDRSELQPEKLNSDFSHEGLNRSSIEDFQ